MDPLYPALAFGVAALATAIILARLHLRTKGAIERFAQRLSRHPADIPLPPGTDAELFAIVHHIESLRRKFRSRILELEDRNQEFLISLEGMNEAVILVDARCRVRLLNRAALDFARLSAGTMCQGRPLLEITRSASIEELTRQAMAQGASPIDTEIEDYASGGRRLVAVHAAPAPGSSGGAVLVLRDLTRLRHLEDLRRDFVSNVSHELRTPIAAILGALETLEDGALHDTSASLRFLGIATSHTRRMAAIIEDLLSLSRLEGGVAAEDLESVKPVELFATVADLYQEAAGAAGMVLEMGPGTDCPPLRCRRELLVQALGNLVENSLRYAAGSNKVLLESHTAAVNGEPCCVLSVRDWGPGIPARDLGRIFERFYRGDSARSREKGGTGLGLAIVKHIALAHGGSVAVECPPDGGTRMTITLPAQKKGNGGK